MEDCFNYDSVPLNYLHCLNPDCERSESCLRHLVTLHVPQSVKSIVTVNPANYPMDAGQCPYFRSTVKLRYAWGISTLFDNIPYKKALLLKGMIRTLFPKPTYYRICTRNVDFHRQNRRKLPGFLHKRALRKLLHSIVIPKNMPGTDIMCQKP